MWRYQVNLMKSMPFAIRIVWDGAIWSPGLHDLTCGKGLWMLYCWVWPPRTCMAKRTFEIVWFTVKFRSIASEFLPGIRDVSESFDILLLVIIKQTPSTLLLSHFPATTSTHHRWRGSRKGRKRLHALTPHWISSSCQRHLHDHCMPGIWNEGWIHLPSEWDICMWVTSKVNRSILSAESIQMRTWLDA